MPSEAMCKNRDITALAKRLIINRFNKNFLSSSDSIKLVINIPITAPNDRINQGASAGKGAKEDNKTQDKKTHKNLILQLLLTILFLSVTPF